MKDKLRFGLDLGQLAVLKKWVDHERNFLVQTLQH